MFSFRKKKPAPTPPTSERLGFITSLFDKIRELPDPNIRLERYVELSRQIFELEAEFGCKCLEFELERDDIADTFQKATNSGVIFACALDYALLYKKVEEIGSIYLSDLPEHLKVRLLHTHIDSELNEFEKIDPIELDPKFQHAFYEVEKRRLNEFEKSRVLEKEFGIKGWRSRREMNPDTLYD